MHVRFLSRACSSKMVFKWRDDHTVKVLDLLKNEECLWNTKSKNYRNKNWRDKALENMVKQLHFSDLTPDDVKLKIKSIRSRYSSELAKVLKSEKSGAGRGDIYVPKLFWFKQADLFLRPVCTPRLSSPTKITGLNDFEEGKDETATEKENVQEEPVVENDDLTDTVVSPVRSKNRRKRSMEKEQPSNKRNKKRRLKPSITCKLKCVQDAIDELKHVSDECRHHEDEFDMFGKAFAVQLRKMPLHRALLCQQKLQQVIIDERMSQINKVIQHTSSPQPTSSSYSSSPSPFSAHSSTTLQYSDSGQSQL